MDFERETLFCTLMKAQTEAEIQAYPLKPDIHEIAARMALEMCQKASKPFEHVSPPNPAKRPPGASEGRCVACENQLREKVKQFVDSISQLETDKIELLNYIILNLLLEHSQQEYR